MSTDPLPLVDMHGIVVNVLRADTGVSGLVEQRVFARKLPAKVTFPAVTVKFPNAVPLMFGPPPNWRSYLGNMECYASSHQAALELAREVQRALHGLEGEVVGGAAISAVDSDGVESGVDEEMTPQKPRWLVSVNITAR